MLNFGQFPAAHNQNIHDIIPKNMHLTRGREDKPVLRVEAWEPVSKHLFQNILSARSKRLE
jgi:hypothetical protein